MINDLELTFCDKKNMTGVTATNAGTLSEIIDLKVPGQGKGRRAFVYITSHTNTAAAVGVNLNFSIITADNETLTTPTEIPLSLPPLAASMLAAGATVYAPLPMDIRRFVKLNVNPGAGTITSLNWSAGITLDPQTNTGIE